LMNNGEPKVIELTFSGELRELGKILDEANSAIAAIGAQSGTSIVYLFGQGIDLVFILAECGGSNANCLLIVDRKTGMSNNDIVLVTDFLHEKDKFCLCMPTEWAGPVGTVECFVR
jgi:hypothetical protein